MDRETLLKKLKGIQMEIFDIGWGKVLSMYHPDVNIEHIEAHKIFAVYKSIYETLLQVLMIKEESDIHKVYNQIQKDILNKGIVYFVKGGKLIPVKNVNMDLYLEIYNIMIENCEMINRKMSQ